MTNSASDLAVIVLAAGMGTRMKSAVPKVLHPLAGKPLLAYALESGLGLGASRTVVVVGHLGQMVEREVVTRFPDKNISCVVQEPQLGTGHAVLVAEPALADFSGRVLILYGDVPLLRTETLNNLLNEVQSRRLPLGLITARLENPYGYGRIIRDAAGRIVRNVEQKDASEDERKIREVNAGIYLAEKEFLFSSLRNVDRSNAQGEYYLPDIIARASQSAGDVASISVDPLEIAGANDRAQLAELEMIVRGRINRRHMEGGVTMHDPASISIDADVVLGRDVVLNRGVVLRGKTTIGEGCVIDVGSVIEDSRIEAGARVKPYSVIERSRIGAEAVIGPFARMRPDSDVGAGCHVGNFVELKKTRMAAGAKAGHLSYLGDSEIGADVNIGAGTITCNYDGLDKHKTIIEDGVFIGSDTQLVAPVKVGRGAYVAAGTTVTKDVPPGDLALTRPEQVHVKGWGEKKAAENRRKAAERKSK